MRARTGLLLVGVLLLGIAPAVRADIIIDFETVPVLPAQPNTFVAAGPAQVITVPGVVTITGGVVLGNPAFLPAFVAHGSAPNLYGTSDLGDLSLQDTITLTFDAGLSVSSVSGVLFNGQLLLEAYTLTAFSGAVPVATALPVLASTSTGGYSDFTLAGALPITSVTITTPNAALNGWDFFIDTLKIQSNLAAVPEPSSVFLLATAVAGVAFTARRLKPRV